MTPTIHAAVPGSGDHRLDPRCPCSPVQLVDLSEPGRVVYVHRHRHTSDTPDPALPSLSPEAGVIGSTGRQSRQGAGLTVVTQE